MMHDICQSTKGTVTTLNTQKKTVSFYFSKHIIMCSSAVEENERQCCIQENIAVLFE